MGSSPEPPPKLADTSGGMSIKKAQLPCWPLYSQQVSHQRWIWGSHKWESMQKGSTLALKPRADVTRSPKLSVASVAPRKGLMFSKKKEQISASKIWSIIHALLQKATNWFHLQKLYYFNIFFRLERSSCLEMCRRLGKISVTWELMVMKASAYRHECMHEEKNKITAAMPLATWHILFLKLGWINILISKFADNFVCL